MFLTNDQQVFVCGSQTSASQMTSKEWALPHPTLSMSGASEICCGGKLCFVMQYAMPSLEFQDYKVLDKSQLEGDLFFFFDDWIWEVK